MTQAYSTLRVAPGDDGVLGVVMEAPPMNLIGPDLVRDLVSLLGELESGQGTRVVVLESADPDYFVPHVDLTCLRGACRPVVRWNSTSATASEPSGYDDYLDADRVIGTSCPSVPGREGYPVLFGGQRHERVIDGAACNAEAAQRVRQFPGGRAAQDQRRGEAGVQ
jgi:hypothetical protein